MPNSNDKNAYDPKRDIIAHCIGCNKIMIIADYLTQPLNAYVASLGFKQSRRFICTLCSLGGETE